MKKLFLVVLAIIAVVCLAACGEKKEPEKVSGETVVSGEVSNIPEAISSTSAEKYQAVIDDYKAAAAEFDLDDIDGEEKITAKYGYVNPSLIMHYARYKDTGIDFTFGYYDIDNNGVDELIVGLGGAAGAIYTYDEVNKIAVKVFFQDTLERGSLNGYDNGILCSSGAGGAALHYYEFGKMTADGLGYESLEKIEEEYVEGKDTPVYRNAESGDTLSYTSIDEIYNKYVGEAKLISLFQ